MGSLGGTISKAVTSTVLRRVPERSGPVADVCARVGEALEGDLGRPDGVLLSIQGKRGYDAGGGLTTRRTE